MAKKTYKLKEAKEVAEDIATKLSPACSLLEIAGSIRRKKELVGDVEIIYVPLILEGIIDGELNLHHTKINKSEEKIHELLVQGVLSYRYKKNGTRSFGERVKLLIHNQSQMPVDLFCCAPKEWANNLVSRTGGKQTNITIASHAKRMGWNWLPFNNGFIHKTTKEVHHTKSEREIFEFVKLPYLEPWERP